MKELLLFSAFAPTSPCDFSAFDAPKVAPVRYEYRLIDGVVTTAPVGSPWPSVRTYTLPGGCANGRCPTVIPQRP